MSRIPGNTSCGRLGSRAVALFLVLLVVACASLAGGDPVIVRAEDVEVNSLSLYNTVIVRYHLVNSTKESPEVYRVMEAIRTKFPAPWWSLHKAIPAYRDVKNKKELLEKVEAVETLYYDLKRIWLQVQAKEALP